MVLRSLSGLLGRAVRRSNAYAELLSSEQFRAALRRERLRADRSQTGFALLTLSFPRRSASLETFTLVAQLLERRIRESDITGWFSDRVIGIILPDTTPDGAWKLAEDLRATLASENLSARFEVYAYPFDQVEETDHFAETEDLKSDDSSSTQTVRPLEALFLQKLPVGKRTVDIMCAGIGLTLASPVMLLAALAIKLTSPGPIFYAQQRDGFGGRKFSIYKFRTMVVNADSLKATLRHHSEQDGPAFKLKNDPRVTPIGRWLRRSCVDELPQLWNVLRGDMSVVGPRPMCSKEALHCSGWERRRLEVTPGLTCIWQVYGGAKVTFTEWMRMDLRYVRSRSPLKDFHLIAATVPAIIRRDGVY